MFFFRLSKASKMGTDPRGPQDWKKLISRDNFAESKLSIRNSFFNRACFFIPSPSLATENKARDWNFQSRMKFSNWEWKFQARMVLSCVGEWLFHAFEQERFFGDLRALGMAYLRQLRSSISSVQTRCIVKTSRFTRGVCKSRWFYSISVILLNLKGL